MFKSLKDVFEKKRFKNTKTKHFKNEDSFDFIQLIQSWEDIVGAPLAKNTHPQKIQYGTLTILTKHATYAQELSYLSQELLKNIYKKYPSLRPHVKKLNFKTSYQFFEKKPVPVKFEKPPIKSQQYNPELKEKYHYYMNRFSDIEDEEMKEILVSLSLQAEEKSS